MRLLPLIEPTTVVLATACAEDFAVSEPLSTVTATAPFPPASQSSEPSATPAVGGVTVGVGAFVEKVSTGTPLRTVDPLTTDEWGQVLGVVDGDTIDLLVAGT